MLDIAKSASPASSRKGQNLALTVLFVGGERGTCWTFMLSLEHAASVPSAICVSSLQSWSLGLTLTDTRVYEPQIRARLGTTAYF